MPFRNSNISSTRFNSDSFTSINMAAPQCQKLQVLSSPMDW